MNFNRLDKISVFTIMGGILITSGWMWFNYVTTYGSLADMFGSQDWVFVFSVCVVATDLFAVLRLLLPLAFQANPHASIWKLIEADHATASIGIAWVIVTGFDTFLTWWFLASRMEFQAESILAPSIIAPYLEMFPVAISIMSWVLGFLLLFGVSKTIQVALQPAFQPSAQYNPQSNPQRNPRNNNPRQSRLP